MPSFYYKAFDATNHKLSGTVDATDARSADRDLRQNGLRPYFLHDVRAIRTAIRKKKRRRRIIFISGAVSIALAFLASGAIVGYAGRERPPDVEAYKRAGLLEDSPQPIIAKSDEEREFAMEILKIWKNFLPGTVNRIEVRKVLMTVYVNRKIRKFPDEDVEVLATQTVKALQRRFSTSGSTILLVEGNETFLEISYTPFTKSLRVKFYR